jgi:hypothetical protein
MDATANPRVPNLTTSAQLSLATAVAMLLCNAAGGHATELQPDIRADRVIFVGGRNLPYQPRVTRPGARADEALVVEERPTLISRWKRLLMVKTSHLREGEAKEISVFDYAGNLLASPRSIVGEIVILEGKRSAILMIKNCSGSCRMPSRRTSLSGGSTFSTSTVIAWRLSNSYQRERSR